MPEVHESVAGIIAGRIRERYNVPSIVLTKGSEGVKGSGRSIEEYNMFEELLKCKNLLGRFGGHPMAAGLSLEEENIDLLRKRLNEICPLSDEDVIPKVVIDMRLPLTHITMKLAEELQTLEPFGKGNTKPLFAEKNIRIQKAMILGANQNVLKLKLLTKNGRFIDAVYFGDIEKFNITVGQLTDEKGNKIPEGSFKFTDIDGKPIMEDIPAGYGSSFYAHAKVSDYAEGVYKGLVKVVVAGSSRNAIHILRNRSGGGTSLHIT
jgi:single-stranded-DNA-specific exonuclease